MAAKEIFPWRSSQDDVSLLPLPPRRLRPAAEHFTKDADFLGSGRREARLMHAARPIAGDSVVLDFGCGPGRFALGLLAEQLKPKGYVGVDIQEAPLIWARRRIGGLAPNFGFLHIEAQNERYSRASAPQTARIPLAEGVATHAHSYSVFSHLRSGDVRWYLRELRRVLSGDGVLRLTAFLEEDVPPEVENPPGYQGISWEGPLHCVRYEKGYFFGLVEEAGLTVVALEHGVETDGQSGLILVPA